MEKSPFCSVCTPSTLSPNVVFVGNHPYVSLEPHLKRTFLVCSLLFELSFSPERLNVINHFPEGATQQGGGRPGLALREEDRGRQKVMAGQGCRRPRPWRRPSQRQEEQV